MSYFSEAKNLLAPLVDFRKLKLPTDVFHIELTPNERFFSFLHQFDHPIVVELSSQQKVPIRVENQTFDQKMFNNGVLYKQRNGLQTYVFDEKNRIFVKGHAISTVTTPAPWTPLSWWKFAQNGDPIVCYGSTRSLEGQAAVVDLVRNKLLARVSSDMHMSPDGKMFLKISLDGFSVVSIDKRVLAEGTYELTLTAQSYPM